MKILLVKISALGDGLDTTPFPRLLRRHGHTVDLLTSNTCLPLWVNNPYLSGIYPVKLSRLLSVRDTFLNLHSILKLFASAATNPYQLVFILHCSDQLRLFAQILFPFTRIYSMSHSKSGSSVLKYRTDKNRTVQESLLFRLAGLPVDHPHSLEFYPRETLHNYHALCGKNLSEFKIISLAVGGGNVLSSATTRRLPANLIVDLISASNPQWHFLLLGYGLEDSDQASFVLSRLSTNQRSKVSSLVNLTNIHEAYSHISASNFFLGGDTGLSKLAAASGTPTLILFGPTSPLLASPLGSNVSSIQTNSSCNTCYLPSDGLNSPMYHCIDPICMNHDIQRIAHFISSSIG